MKFKMTMLGAGLLCLSGPSFAADFNYDKLGADWPALCETGKRQSPINIETQKARPSDFVAKANYHPNRLEAVNNGHTVQFNPESQSITLIDKQSGKKDTFALVQFHLHNGSEHTVNGTRHDLEAHFVHANTAFLAGEPDGRLAVVGVFLNQGKDGQSQAWNQLLSDLPGKKGAHDFRAADVQSLLPAGKNHKIYTYDGSLTTPGCSEVVNWMVLAEPMNVSAKAIKAFAKSQKGHETYRVPQPLHGRQVTTGEYRVVSE